MKKRLKLLPINSIISMVKDKVRFHSELLKIYESIHESRLPRGCGKSTMLANAVLRVTYNCHKLPIEIMKLRRNITYRKFRNNNTLDN